MKRTLLAIVASAPIYLLAQQNEIKNGDFEKWNSNQLMPSGWTNLFSGEESVVQKSLDAQSGKNSLRITFTPENRGQNKKFRTSDIQLVAGVYTLTCYFKGKGEVRFISLTKKGETASSKESVHNIVGTPSIGKVDTAEWTAYKLKFEITQKDLYQLTFAINSGSVKVPFLLDNVSIIKD